MPQRGERDVGVYFGRISPDLWDRLKEQPGAIIEKAIALLDEARRSGREFHYPASLTVGVRKKIWLTAESAAVLDRISTEVGRKRTPVILAALDLYFGDAPSGQGPGED